MQQKQKFLTLVLGAMLLNAGMISNSIADTQVAPVSGFARSFIADTMIPHATITVLETGQKFKTDKHGSFGPFNYPVGKPITLLFEKFGYQTTQSGTVVVPPEGLTSPYNNITFQVPSTIAYFILSAIVGAKFDPNSCHVATTVTAYRKTLHDIPQGEAHAHIVLTPSIAEKPFYFDIFESGPLKGKTNPFTHGLNETTLDGGVGFVNLPARSEPYKLTAQKDGVTFSEVEFICNKGAFVNLSPPRGPTTLQDDASKLAHN